MSTIQTGRQSQILRQRLRAELAGLPVVWGAFTLFVAVLVGAVALLRARGIETSGWEQATQLARWYAGAVGAYLTAVYAPLYVTHGYTRREFALQLPVFVLVFAAAWSVFMTLGFLIETAVYAAFDWRQTLAMNHLFETPTQVHLVFLEFWVIGLAWIVAGALVGGAFYRRALLGFAFIPVGLFFIVLIELAAGPSYFGPLPGGLAAVPVLGPVVGQGSAGAAAVVAAGVFAAGLGLAWTVIRDLPIRSKTA